MLAALTLTGWIFMLGSNAFVVILTAWCFIRVLGRPEPGDE